MGTCRARPPRGPPRAVALASFYRHFDTYAALTLWRAQPVGGDHLLLLLAPPDAPPPPPGAGVGGAAAARAAAAAGGPHAPLAALLDAASGELVWLVDACGDEFWQVSVWRMETGGECWWVGSVSYFLSPTHLLKTPYHPHS